MGVTRHRTRRCSARRSAAAQEHSFLRCGVRGFERTLTVPLVAYGLAWFSHFAIERAQAGDVGVSALFPGGGS